MRNILIIILILMASAAMSTETVFKAGGGADYEVTYPDNWHRVPYGEVNIFLESQGLNDSTFQYTAVLAEKSDEPFYLGPYLFLGFDPIEELVPEQVEIILNQVAEEYGNAYIHGTLAGNLNNYNLEQPVFDSALNAVAIKSEIPGAGGNKTLLEIKKFYEKGIVSFFCFAPMDLYPDKEKVFLDIFRSFVYVPAFETSADADLKIVDVTTQDNRGKVAFGSMTIFIIVVIMLLIGIGLIIYRTKRR